MGKEIFAIKEHKAGFHPLKECHLYKRVCPECFENFNDGFGYHNSSLSERSIEVLNKFNRLDYLYGYEV